MGCRPDPASVREAKAAVRSTRKPAEQTVETEAVEAGAAGKIRAPAGLKGEALAVWDRLAPKLRAARLLGQIDELAFARYCRNYAKWKQLRDALDKRGYSYDATTVGGGKLRRIDPTFMVADRLERQLLATEDRFGMNPAERQRIMGQRAAGGVARDLFDQPERATDDPAAPAAEPAAPVEGPIGFLN